METAEKDIVSVQMPREMRLELRRRASEADRTFSAEIRRAISAYLDQQTRPKEAAK